MTSLIRIADDVEPAPSSSGVSSRTDAGSRPVATGADDLAEELSTVLGQLVRLIRREAPISVGPGSFSALATLERCGPMRLGDLAAREGVAPPTLTRMIANLERDGYVLRRPDPRDRRAIRVSLTDRGRELVATVLAVRADVLQTRMEGLTDEARRALAGAVPVLQAIAASVG